MCGICSWVAKSTESNKVRVALTDAVVFFRRRIASLVATKGGGESEKGHLRLLCCLLRWKVTFTSITRSQNIKRGSSGAGDLISPALFNEPGLQMQMRMFTKVRFCQNDTSKRWKWIALSPAPVVNLPITSEDWNAARRGRAHRGNNNNNNVAEPRRTSKPSVTCQRGFVQLHAYSLISEWWEWPFIVTASCERSPGKWVPRLQCQTDNQGPSSASQSFRRVI